MGEEIRPLLQAASPDGVSATVTDGRYRLLWGDTLYTASDDTVPRWTSATFDATRTTPRRVCRVGEELRVAGAYTVSGVAFLVWLRLTGERDSEVSHTGDSWMDATFSTTDVLVTGSLCTKQFAFGSAEEYKQITRVFAEAEADGVALATYLTERGRQTELPCFVEDGLELTPGGLRCRYFALRLEGEGLRVGGITVHLIGGQR